MKAIFIVGKPGSGKTTTSNNISKYLEDNKVEHNVIHIDGIYLDFIKEKYHYLGGEFISKNIQWHYERISYDIKQEFFNYLLEHIQKKLLVEYIIIEGRHLEDMIYRLNKYFITIADITNVYMDNEIPIVLRGTKLIRDMDIYKSILSI